MGSSETVKWAAAPERKYPFLVTFSSRELVARYLNVYRDQAKQYGYEASPDQLGWASPVYVADTDERARKEAKEGVETLFNDFLAVPFQMLLPPGYMSLPSMKNTMRMRKALGAQKRLTFEELNESGVVVVGSPKTVRRQAFQAPRRDAGRQAHHHAAIRHPVGRIDAAEHGDVRVRGDAASEELTGGRPPPAHRPLAKLTGHRRRDYAPPQERQTLGRTFMRKVIIGLLGATALLAGTAVASAQGTVKIGLIMPYSGQFADTASQMDNAIKLYVKEHGDTVAGKKIEFIRKDTGGIAPDVAKRLAQELITRDKVDILTGLILTPNTLAVADVSAQAKVFSVIMNAATSIITTKSPYMARTSVTTPMLNQTLGTWAVKTGSKKIYSMVSDFGPGIDAEGAFQLGVKEAGGEIVGSVRFPVANPDFSAFVQRAKDLNPDTIYIWIPGRHPAGRGRQGADRARHRSEEDQGHGPGRAGRRQRAEEHGRRCRGHHHRGALRLQPSVGEEQSLREGLQRDQQRPQPRHLLDRRL